MVSKAESPQERIWLEVGMQGKKVRKHRFQGGGIPNGFIFIRRIGFLSCRYFRMQLFEIIIQKSNVPDNAKSISKDGKLVRITEMAIHVLLFRMGEKRRPVKA